jgi:hypothetical protein
MSASELNTSEADLSRKNAKLRYARLMLQQFHTDRQQNSATIDDYVSNYAKNI